MSGNGHAAFAMGQKPPKHFIDPSPIISGGIRGPDRLTTAPFNSHHSAGFTAWHYSQGMQDLDFPLENTPTPLLEGTVYVHRNINDGGFQIWVWREIVPGHKTWHPTNMDGDPVVHPKINDQLLRLTKVGKPSWVLASTMTTYELREILRGRSQLRPRTT